MEIRNLKLGVVGIAFLLLTSAIAIAQSRLDGVTFDASIYNMPDSVGVVRFNDVPDSNCRNEGGVDGDDVPGEECLTFDSGLPAVTMTFNAGAQAIGGLLVTPTVEPFAGRSAEDVIVVNNASFPDVTDVLLTTWSTSGDLIEFTFRTADGSFPATEEVDFFGFSARGIQYPNTPETSEVMQHYQEEPGNYLNSYLWFETADGPVTDYEAFLPVGIGIGEHPTDPSREVVYPFWGAGQTDEFTDTTLGGGLSVFSHGSQLDSNPEVGNLLFLADGVGGADATFDSLSVTGWGLGLLVQPPEAAMVAGPTGDFDADGELTAADIDLLSMALDMTDLSFDLTGDGMVNAEDHAFWVTELAGSFPGDADLNGTVEFPDFLAMSAGFGMPGGWANGDFDGTGDTQFSDFLLLSANFGQTAAAAVPEPSSVVLLLACGAFVGMLRRRR